MTSHRLPFENRWTSGEHAWEWNCELERLGLPNVRALFGEHETHHADERVVIFDIPTGFVRDWLAFHDRRTARRRLIWQAAVLALAFIAATAAVVSAMRDTFG
jgi:hypothetical protein